MLQKFPAFAGVKGPVVVVVMDGYGIPKHDVGSAIDAARKPTLDRLFAEYPNIRLRAHGTAVGMPSDDDMGNSEVGHNAIGAGQVYAQGAALVANAIAVPLTERVFVPERWLPEQGFFARVLGYTFTVGFTAEFLKYAVLRYTVWLGHFRQRLDAAAYALAVSLGFATVLNVRYALETDATVVATGLWVASNTFAHLATGLVVGFFLGELRTGRPAVIWMPAGLLMAALLGGVHYGFRGIAIVSGLGIDETASRPIGGLLLSFVLVGVTLVVFAFLIQSADQRQEAVAGRRELL